MIDTGCADEREALEPLFIAHEAMDMDQKKLPLPPGDRVCRAFECHGGLYRWIVIALPVGVGVRILG